MGRRGRRSQNFESAAGDVGAVAGCLALSLVHDPNPENGTISDGYVSSKMMVSAFDTSPPSICTIQNLESAAVDICTVARCLALSLLHDPNPENVTMSAPPGWAVDPRAFVQVTAASVSMRNVPPRVAFAEFVYSKEETLFETSHGIEYRRPT